MFAHGKTDLDIGYFLAFDIFSGTPMSKAARASVVPRRNPSQSRSVVTVEAIFQATIQVLLKDGMHGLTTTRVAGRAGVSVGTLYQYYPNKQALLYAVLSRHLQGIAAAVAAAALKVHHKSLAVMVPAVVDAFVKSKLERDDEARALYSVAGELACSELVAAASAKGGTALAAMLSTASDATFKDLKVASYMFASAMIGPTRGVLEGQAPPKMLRVLRAQLTSLCLGYLEREAVQAPAVRR